MASKKKKPIKGKKPKKTSKKRELEGYYIDGNGSIKILYKKDGGISIWQET